MHLSDSWLCDKPLAHALQPEHWIVALDLWTPDVEGHPVETHKMNNTNKLNASRSYVWPVLCGLLLIGSILQPGLAQAQMVSDNIQQYIERTEELLIWAHGLVTETNSEPARRILRQAADMHQRSMGMLERGMMMESLSVARRARDTMWHAVREAREAMGLEERIRIRSERFRDQHGHLMERARESHNEQALEFLERARRQAGRARDIYHQGDFKLAWKLLEQAGDLMRRSARLLADSGGPERMERELERAQQLIDATRDRLGTEATANQRQLLAEAEEALQRALAARDQGQPGRVLQMTGLAANLARRAAQGAGLGPDEDAVRRQLDRFDTRAERIGDRVRESGSAPARKMYERALGQRERAVAAHRAGDAELALRQIRAAHDLLNQADELSR